MTNQHPITPPPGLVQEWIDEPQYMTEDQLGKRMYMISLHEVKFREIISKASQYGADQELEACVEWLEQNQGRWEIPASLRAARRPKPPSLKERALALVEQHEEGWRPSPKDWDTIRRALEALPDNTSQPS
jgi:hypothetical protein